MTYNPYNNISGGVVTRPDDLLGIRNQIYAQVGVPEALAEVNKYKQQLQENTAQFREAQNTAENRLVDMNKITGIQATQGRAYNDSQQSLAEQARLAQDIAQSKLAEANTLLGYREKEIQEKKNLMAQYSGAGISFADDFQTAISKAHKYQQKMLEKEKKDREKEYLRQAYMQVYGYPPKHSYSRKKLRKKIKKKSKALAREAKALANRDYQMKLEEHNLRMAKLQQSLNRGSGTSNVEDRRALVNVFEQYKGDNGKVDPQLYNQEMTKWIAEGGDANDFYDLSRNYINTSRINDYNLPVTPYQASRSQKTDEIDFGGGGNKESLWSKIFNYFRK